MKQTTLGEHEKAINRVVEYINSHLYDKPSMNQLAEIANISGFHFHRIFKAVIGENIGEFTNRLRLENIALLLTMKDVTLSDLALQTGYETKQALSRAFKNHFGISPSVFKKQGKDAKPFFGTDHCPVLELEPELRYEQPRTIVYKRIIDIYGAAEPYANAWQELGRFARDNDLVGESIEFIGLSFDDPAITPPAKCRFYACFTPNRVVKPQGAYGVRTISGGKYVVFTLHGSYTGLKNFYYNIFVRWLPNSKFRLRGSLSFERYLNSPTQVAEDELRTEVYVPIY